MLKFFSFLNFFFEFFFIKNHHLLGMPCFSKSTMCIITIILGIVATACTLLGCNELLCPLLESHEANVIENSVYTEDECTRTTCGKTDKNSICIEENSETYDCSYWTTHLLIDNNQTCVVHSGPWQRDNQFIIFYNVLDHSCNENTIVVQNLPYVGITFICCTSISLIILIWPCSNLPMTY
jgi:hypothetical protein